MNFPNNGRRVAVIGAGVAGLAATKYLLAEGFLVTIFERKARPGGVWNTAQANGLYPSPVYDGLETNVQRTLMTFSDHPWPVHASLCPQSIVVDEYLQSYAKRIADSEQGQQNLTMCLNAEVTDLRKAKYQATAYWRLSVRRHQFGLPPEEECQFFQMAIVAIGNYHTPDVPQYPGLQEWWQSHPASLLHAVQYRNASEFRNQTVLVIGNSASGWDISSQLTGVARTVLVSSSRNGQLSADSHIGFPGVQCLDHVNRTVHFVDGTSAYNVDRIIFCTGYKYDFPFIKKGTATGDELLFGAGLKVGNVYNHIFYTEDPTLAFVGLPVKTAAFTVAEAQSAVIARTFNARIQFPAKTFLRKWAREYTAEWEQQMQAGQAGAKDYHSFNLQTDNEYVNELLDMSMNVFEDQKTTCFGDGGQAPPYWCECLNQARTQSRAVRDAFRALGDQRHRCTNLHLLGFSVQRACRNGFFKVQQHQNRCESCFIHLT